MNENRNPAKRSGFTRLARFKDSPRKKTSARSSSVKKLSPSQATLETKTASGIVGQWGKWGLHKMYICELEKALSDLEKAPSEVYLFNPPYRLRINRREDRLRFLLCQSIHPVFCMLRRQGSGRSNGKKASSVNIPSPVRSKSPGRCLHCRKGQHRFFW